MDFWYSMADTMAKDLTTCAWKPSKTNNSITSAFPSQISEWYSKRDSMPPAMPSS